MWFRQVVILHYIFQNLEPLCTEPNFDGGILCCYGEKNEVPSANVGKSIQFHEGVPENITKAGSRPCLIFLDDLLDADSKVIFKFLDAQLLVKRVRPNPAYLAAHNTALQAGKSQSIT